MQVPSTISGTETPSRLSFGIKTIPQRTSYEEILRVWREADAVALIEHAWLWDHLMPFRGDPRGPMFEGWTLLAALAARTERLGLGLMVASNQYRPPAILAKVAATVDVVSGGRLVFGIGAGGTQFAGLPAEAEGFGLTLPSHRDALEQLAEACTLIRRLWSEPEPLDFDGQHYRLAGAICEPKPVQSRVPILMGGWGERMLRIVAEHADLWNMPGPPHFGLAQVRDKSAALDEQCAAIGRDPAMIVRSVQQTVDVDDPAATRAALLELIDIGVHHLVLNLPQPYPHAQWLAEQIVEPVLAQAPVAGIRDRP